MNVMRKNERFGTRFVMDEIVEAGTGWASFCIERCFRKYLQDKGPDCCNRSLRTIPRSKMKHAYKDMVSACATWRFSTEIRLLLSWVVGTLHVKKHISQPSSPRRFTCWFDEMSCVHQRSCKIECSTTPRSRSTGTPACLCPGRKWRTGYSCHQQCDQEERIWHYRVFSSPLDTPNSTAFTPWLDHDENGYLITKADSTLTNILAKTKESLWRCARPHVSMR